MTLKKVILAVLLLVSANVAMAAEELMKPFVLAS